MAASGLRRRVAALLIALPVPLAPSLAHAAPPDPVQAKTSKGAPAVPGSACLLCSVLALADDVIFATPPLLRLPEVVEFLYRTTDAEFVHLKSAGSAPPAATRHDS